MDTTLRIIIISIIGIVFFIIPVGIVGFFVLALVRLVKWLKISCEEATKVRLELGKIAEEISLIRKAQTTEEPAQESP